jgi:hypothetical protein
VTAIGDLETVRPLALDDNFTVERAQFDLANVAASYIDLFGDQGRALQAAKRLALRNVFAAVNVNANRCGRRAEVGLKHERR